MALVCEYHRKTVFRSRGTRCVRLAGLTLPQEAMPIGHRGDDEREVLTRDS